MEERCIICGAVIPEGRQVCPMCESEAVEAFQELSLYKRGHLCLVPADIYEKQCKELDELKEKQTAKKVETEEVCGVTVYSCPVCEMYLYNEQCYCDRCGQYIDWSEEGI